MAWLLGVACLGLPETASGDSLLWETYGPDFKLSIKETQALHDKAEQLFDDARFEEAFASLEKAVAITEKAFGSNHRDLSILLPTLAEARMFESKFDDAQTLLARSLAIGGNAFGSNHPVVGRALLGLAVARITQGQRKEGTLMLDRSLSVHEKWYGSNHLALALPLRLRSLAARIDDNRKDAWRFIGRSCRILEEHKKMESMLYAENLNDIADIFTDEANYRRAFECNSRSLAIFERVGSPAHPSVIRAWENRADIFREQGAYADAYACIERAAELATKTLGTNHLWAVPTFNTAGILCMEMGALTRAKALFEQALSIEEKWMGTNHPHSAHLLMNLGTVYEDMGSNQEALELYSRALHLLGRDGSGDGPLVATCLGNLASIYQSQGSFDLALDAYNRSLAIRKTLHGEDHPDYARTLGNIGCLYHDWGRDEEALSFHFLSLQIRTNYFDWVHPEIAGCLENIAFSLIQSEDFALGFRTYRAKCDLERELVVRNLCGFDEKFTDPLTVESYYSVGVLEALCGSKQLKMMAGSQVVGAEHLSLAKGLVLEVQAVRAALEADPHSTTRSLRAEYSQLHLQMDKLAANDMSPDERGEARKNLQTRLAEMQKDFSERQGLLGQVLQDQHVSLSAIAQNLPSNSALLDLVEFTSRDFKAKTNVWREPRYAAYLTFPLARDSTNVVVERVDLGEAVPINEAVELICRRMGAGQFRAKDLEAALQRVSELVYAPLARHLTNVSHLIVCPDGQLSRVPFEMLLVSGRGEPPRYLVEEKTVSYVGSGREVARLAQPSTQVKTNAPMVMGNPDFDFALPGSSRREEAQTSQSQIVNRKSEMDRSLVTSAATNGEVRLLTSPATKTLSRSYRGIKFGPLPGSEAEAMNVAKLLGGDTVLRLGAEAREAELKAVVSPRVLHLATHGFFLTDQEFKRTNAGPGLAASSAGDLFGSQKNNRTRWNASLPENDWENPMVRCGIALAGANHATNLMTRSSRREEAQTAKSQIPNPQSEMDQSLLTSAATRFEVEDGLLTGLEASLLNLQGTELVILSACESGAGEVKIGEGVMSLRRAFRIAGAETVLASHWKVSDQATSRLMTEFMRRWRAGEPRAKAWRQAQLALLRSEKFSNPYFWAAFTLTGQWR